MLGLYADSFERLDDILEQIVFRFGVRGPVVELPQLLEALGVLREVLLQGLEREADQFLATAGKKKEYFF